MQQNWQYLPQPTTIRPAVTRTNRTQLMLAWIRFGIAEFIIVNTGIIIIINIANEYG